MASGRRRGGGEDYEPDDFEFADLVSAGLGWTSGVRRETMEQMKRSAASQDIDHDRVMRMFDTINVRSEEKDQRIGLLHDAASKGAMDTCKHLVEHLGFDVNSVASDGSGYDGMARLLISRGAIVDVCSSEGTPLHVSASYGKSGVLQILLEHHADPNIVSADHRTPLAAILGVTPDKVIETVCLKCMKLLVKAGADPNSSNPDTPLVIATSKGLSECVKYLLEVGADANIQTKRGGSTPLEIAAKSRRRNLVELLFPFTSPIQSVPDWSVEGIIAHVKSRPSKAKVGTKFHVLNHSDEGEASEVMRKEHSAGPSALSLN
ncbi:hypothetical protein EJB05_05206 [Eragrostis curvula]|uniref:Uncharacterized protein n=1 Tax=Eragrostis curvula TaxID=38414 RepID=A0A5J9WE62_9POAL|nr:hypothetical protein EJB05_05206 [Eragrostis curvula]